MQTLVDHLTTYPRALKAANDELSPVPAVGHDKADRQLTAGWDPYEVWRTRIKTPQDSSKPRTR